MRARSTDPALVLQNSFHRSGRGRESSNSYGVSHAWSRTQETPIPLSFHTRAIFKSGRGREQSSNSHDVSDDLWRSQGAPIVPLFHKPVFFCSRGGAESKVRASMVCLTLGRARKKHRSLSSSSNQLFISQRGREQTSNTMTCPTLCLARKEHRCSVRSINQQFSNLRQAETKIIFNFIKFSRNLA